ncbi:MAG: DUF6174 domain-containing protein [bacterium]|nr:MAG: hypothetical protein DIU52_00370 [bacterium]
MRSLAPRGLGPIVLAAALALGVGACEFVYDPDHRPARELERARDRWRREAPRDYRYEFEMECFCGAELHRPVIVWVRNGAVYEVVYADDGRPVPTPHLQYYRTIDGLFEVIGDAINRRADDIDVDYDSRYGYPRFAEIDFERRVVDDEIRFTVRRFRPVRF